LLKLLLLLKLPLLLLLLMQTLHLNQQHNLSKHQPINWNQLYHHHQNSKIQNLLFNNKL
jgi:hypothetical protein